jgi:RHS repeat-associated protein
LTRPATQYSGSGYMQIVYGPQGRFATMNGQTLLKAFIPLPTGATAFYGSSGLLYYRHTDHLGSARLATTPNRTLYASGSYAPYGETYSQTGNSDISFAGQERYTVTGIHDALLRKYSTAQGRWLSPDAAGLGAVDPGNPQSWNRYAYALNNPMALIDPMGDDAYEGCGPMTPYCYSNLFANPIYYGQWANPFESLLKAFSPTAILVHIDPEFPYSEDHSWIAPVYGNWDLATLGGALSQVIWSPWYSVKGTLEGRGQKGEIGLNPTTSYGFDPQSDLFVALPDNTMKGQCINLVTPGGKAAFGVPVGDVGPINGGGPTMSRITAWNDPYWSPGGILTPQGYEGGGFHQPLTASGFSYRGRTQFARGAGIDISYALQQKLGLTGNTQVSWQFATCRDQVTFY